MTNTTTTDKNFVATQLEILGTNLYNFINDAPALEELQIQARNQNGWFTRENTLFALKNWQQNLTQPHINTWLQAYDFGGKINKTPKNIGIVAAGNVPLVAIHDVLCVLCTGNIAQIKLSAMDTVLMQKIFDLMPNDFKKNIHTTDRLQKFDAVIATGSNNTARYFEYYFGKVPNIIRKSRTSVAILNGNETEVDLKNLGNDIFTYFGLGCRNVTKLYVPVGYDFVPFLRSTETYHSTVAHHHKYFNNYEYNLAIALLNQTPHLGNLFLILIQNPQLASSVGVLHYEYYTDPQDLEDKILQNHQQLQCVVGDEKLFAAAMPFGTAQTPPLNTYADNIDTIEFLLDL